MQVRNILLVLFFTLLLAGVCLYFLPTNRTYSTETEISADKLITYRTLSDTANWVKWDDGYINGSQRKLIDIITDNNNKEFHYVSKLADNSTVEGAVYVVKSNNWNTKLLWSEEIIFKEKNILQKLRLLFKPTEFKQSFLESIENFKNLIEHPDGYFAGIEFEKVQVPANKFVTLTDTVDIKDINSRVYQLKDSIINKFTSEIKDKETFYSQHEFINDSLLTVRVGVIVNDDLWLLPEPYNILDMDAYQAIVMNVNGDYNELKLDVNVMHQWLKKNSARPAFDFWVEHQTNEELKNLNAKVTIIQEYYSVK